MVRIDSESGESYMKLINIYLAGDSTVQSYSKENFPQGGWGQFLEEFLPDHVQIHNHAIGGRSSKTFIGEGRLNKIIERIQPEYYLFVQMGHNDSSENRPARYTKPFDDYPKYLKQYITRTMKKKEKSLLIIPVTRLNYKNGNSQRDFEEYCRLMKQVAQEEEVPLLDLMEKSNQHLVEIGYKEAESYYMASINGDDFMHFTIKSARKMAEIVARNVREVL